MICVSLARMGFGRLRRVLPRLAMAEIRLDEMSLSRSEITALFAAPLPLIATCRPGRYGQKERLGMLAAAIAGGAAYVDIEADAGEDFGRILRDLAKDHGCRLIVSHHDEHGTPATRRLERLMHECFSREAAIAKLACWTRSRQDALRIVSLYSRSQAGSLIALGMGAKGRWTRVAAPFLGAPFTYAALSPRRATAAGQMSAAAMARMLAALGEK